MIQERRKRRRRLELRIGSGDGGCQSGQCDAYVNMKEGK